MPDENDPMVWDLARIIAARQGREPDSDHYGEALDLITQLRARGHAVVCALHRAVAHG